MFPFGLVDVTTNKSKSYLNLSIFPNCYLDSPMDFDASTRLGNDKVLVVPIYLSNILPYQEHWDKTVGNIHVFGFNTLAILDT
jgi:hypothetical protein